EVARREAPGRRQALALGVGEELDRRRLPAVGADLDPGEAPRTLRGREAHQVVELAARERRAAARDGETADGVARGQRLREHAEAGPREAGGQVGEPQVDATVGPVDAVA